MPACLAVGAVCAALVAHLLYASARTVSDPRLLWMSAGVTVAFAGLVATLLGQPTISPNGGPISQAEDSLAARYVIWHVALLAAGAIAVFAVRTRPRELIAFGAGALALLLWASLADAPLGDLAAADGSYHATVRTVVGIIALAQIAVAVLWWLRAEGGPTWGEMCVICLMTLSGLDALAYLLASQAYEGAWWASLTLRAGQFAVPAVGLVIGFIAVADRLRDLQNELGRGLELELERAGREDELANLDRHRRERERGKLARLIDGDGLGVALQPIVDLGSRRVVGAEALARFKAADGDPLPTEQTFLDAHTLGLGAELELAVIDLALRSEGRLPDGLYLALNVSPTLLAGDELLDIVARHDHSRPLVIEITEHQAVEDYSELDAALGRLREHGVRVAVDDVGSGFASFRHVTRVNPEILKLDRSLVCGIDEDPARQSLASAIVSFARDVGAIVVSEGIESGNELECLMDLSVGCGQGFYLARPELGRVESRVLETVAG
ncbi:MAG TPA: EAL domain-containing protein [Solirubrobacteraceae bacterium]|nr:EAL domain-containing protein [Solirubrobacteraceae bacterium]